MVSKILYGLVIAFTLLCLSLGGLIFFRQRMLLSLIICRSNCLNMNLVETNLSVIDLGFVEISAIDLSEIDLSQTNLRGANLNGVILSRANLQGTNLSEANLHEANLRGADLRESNLSGAKLTKADLDEADLQGADLSRADMTDISLHKANLDGSNLHEADLTRANLAAAKLLNADLAQANLCKAEFDSKPHLNERFHLLGECTGEIHTPVTSCEEAKKRGLLDNTFLCVYSQEGWEMAQGGRGHFWIATPQDNDFSVRVSSSNNISVKLQRREAWHFALSSPEGIAVGVYEDSGDPETRLSVSSQAKAKGLDEEWHDYQVGCDADDWRFNILEIVYESAGEVQHFAANFELACTVTTLSGYIRFNSTIELD